MKIDYLYNNPKFHVTMIYNDLKTQDSLLPLLGSLFVESTFRNRGIAEQLIN